MPSRNVIKIDIPDSHYHVYARGASRAEIFHDGEDYNYFLSLFGRYLSVDEKSDSVGRPYVHLREDLELLAFCLMSNHFHLMFYQNSEGSICTLMRGVMTSYSRYFNKKYDRYVPSGFVNPAYSGGFLSNEVVYLVECTTLTRRVVLARFLASDFDIVEGATKEN